MTRRRTETNRCRNTVLQLPTWFRCSRVELLHLLVSTAQADSSHEQSTEPIDDHQPISVLGLGLGLGFGLGFGLRLGLRFELRLGLGLGLGLGSVGN